MVRVSVRQSHSLAVRQKLSTSQVGSCLQDSTAGISTKPEAAASAAKLTGIGKDPTTHTAFLPDKEREQQEQQLREQLKQEYELRQQVCWNSLCSAFGALWSKCCFANVLKVQLCYIMAAAGELHFWTSHKDEHGLAAFCACCAAIHCTSWITLFQHLLFQACAPS